MKRNPKINSIYRYILILFLFFSILLLSGCYFLSPGNISSTPGQQESIKPRDGEEINHMEEEPPVIVKGDLPQEIVSMGQITLNALKDYKYEKVEELINRISDISQPTAEIKESKIPAHIPINQATIEIGNK